MTTAETGKAGNRVIRIPRAPVFGSTTLGQPHASEWPRVDQQGRCWFTTSGRASILLALRALGIGKGQEVLMPTYHCPTMVEPAVHIGATPLFYPIGSQGEPDLHFLQSIETRHVKAMLAVHFFGLPQDLTGVWKFCDARGIALIEDCAHAYFGRSALGPVGAVGDFAIGSLGKFFPVVEGGCLVARSPAVMLPRLGAAGVWRETRVAWDILELGAAAGRLRRGGALVSALTGLKNYVRRQGNVSKVDSVAADPSARRTIDAARAVTEATRSVKWIVQHADVQRIASARRANYRTYTELLVGQRRMRPLFPELPDGAVPYVFPLEVDDPFALYMTLRERGVPLYRWDTLWPGTPILPHDAGGRWATHVFQLACHQDMSELDVCAVVDVVKGEALRVCK